MTSSARPTRRGALRSVMATAVVPLGPHDTDAGTASHLVELIRARTSAEAIGRAAIASRPDEADADRLIAGLRRAHPALVKAAEKGARAVARAALGAAIADDFAHGRCRTVDGAILAMTEVRLCVLCAIGAGGGAA